ncbi:TPA: hypothetical protein RY392_002813 [Escherichia albertii]|nr:hypothetical protein [Escherichia albertii]HEB1551896.1 hypothetical protein [Escherichia albertii]
MAVLQVDRGLPVLEVLVERDGVQLLLTSREVIPVTVGNPHIVRYSST